MQSPPTAGRPDAPGGRVTFARRPGVRWRTTLRGVVVATTSHPEPVLVTRPGDAVWDELATPRTLDELVAVLAASFAADPDVVRADVSALVDHLVELGALERSPLT